MCSRGFSYFQEYNPDVMDNGSNLAKQKLCPEEKHIDQDVRVILGDTVGVMINGYTHEDQSTS